MVRFTSKIIATFAAILMATSASADSVTIKLTDGNFVLAGELISEKGLDYVVRTPFGTMQIAKSVSVCEGCKPALMAMAD